MRCSSCSETGTEMDGGGSKLEKSTNASAAGRILEGKRVFLSGPMTGIEHNNVDSFALAHAICKEHGAAYVYNPAAAWLRETAEESAGKTHQDYLARTLRELTRIDWGDSMYDYVVLLPGWAESEGARTEYEVARACGIKTIDLCDIEDDV